jgi:hypothetical protein
MAAASDSHAARPVFQSASVLIDYGLLLAWTRTPMGSTGALLPRTPCVEIGVSGFPCRKTRGGLLADFLIR